MAKSKKKLPKTEGDFLFLILIICIAIFGTIMIYSASYYHSISKNGNPYSFVFKDFIFKCIGFAAFFVLANIDYHRLTWRSCYGSMVVGIPLLIVVLFFGSAGNNAVRWIKVFGFTIMPGEIIKTCFILFLAKFISTDPSRLRTKKGLAIIFGLTVGAFILVFKQPSLTTALTIVALVFAILIVAGFSVKGILGCGILGSVGLAVLMKMKGADYMFERVRTAINPWLDPTGDGYQVIQSLLALGSGGVRGLGLGKSIQKTLYLPEPENDYILAIIGEELGYVGVIVLMLVYILIVWRIFRIAVRARDSFGMLLASGVGLHIAIHVIINIAIVSATFPPTGIVLPFVSSGGNAVMLFLAECGIVFSVSRYPADELIPENALPAAGGA